MPIYIITSIWVLAGKHVNLVDYRTSNCIFEINTIYRALYWCVSLIEIYYYVFLMIDSGIYIPYVYMITK